MPDNVGYTPGEGATVAADDIGGVLYQRVKIGIGADGVATDVSATNPMPVTGAVDTGFAQPLTDAQLRAAAVSVSNQSLTNLDTDLGALADAAATSDTGNFSVISFIKRGMQNWTTLLSRIPALVGGRIPIDGSGVTQPISGTVTANTGLNPLTDTQLRASAVPVSGPLTDAQLRATPVPVSGTITANTGLSQPLTDTQLRAAAVPVSGTVNANTGLTQPLTDAQLRAASVPVTGSVQTTEVGELIEAIESMRMAIQSLNRSIGMTGVDPATGRLRVLLDAITASLTLATITTVTTVSTVSSVTNQAQLGGQAANSAIPSWERNTADNIRRNIIVS